MNSFYPSYRRHRFPAEIISRCVWPYFRFSPSFALFDLLCRPGLQSKEVQRIKKVATELLATLQTEKLRVENWREKEATRDAVHVVIENFLWVDHTGLPSLAYSEGDVKAKREDVFRHVCRVYPTVPSPYYIVH